MKKLLLVLLPISIWAQTSLPRSSPSKEKVSAAGISDFIQAINQSQHELHSFMVLRHGKVVAEGWWNPYAPHLSHTMYSCSKSFTATAVGFAVSEGKLSVEDQVIKFFPEKTPLNPSENLKNLKIKHLLSMAVGHEKEPSHMAASDDWVKVFLTTPIAKTPGSEFLYNSAATYMCSAIVQKVTGQKVVDYLKPRLFDPLGISGYDWEVDPNGVNVGGWGLRIKTEDMAKFGQLFLQNGKWKGKQVLPEAWVKEASTTKIMQGDPKMAQSKRDSSDWLQGYAYQMWRSRHGSYRGDGANGQFILVLPDQDAVIAITAETSNMQDEINLVWKHLLPAFDKTSNKTDDQALLAQLKTLSLKKPINEVTKVINNKKFSISGDATFKSFALKQNGDQLQLDIETDSVNHTLGFGSKEWVYNSTTKLGPYLVARAKANRYGLGAFKTAGMYHWKDENTLELTHRYIQSPHTETIVIHFDGESTAQWDVVTPFNKNQKRTPLTAFLNSVRQNPPKLIVRGDDMGFSHAANVALIESAKNGIETSIEIIVPSPWFPEAVKLLKENPKIDVGLHFAITAEWDQIKWRPLTPAPSLRNADGYFYPMLFHNHHYDGQAVLDNTWQIADYEAELRAQIAMAKKYIPQLSHVSGHMGSLSFDPKIKSVVDQISQETGLPMVDTELMKTKGIEYVYFNFAGKNTEQRIDAFIDMLSKLEDGKTYVYVEHPGLKDPEMMAISHIGYEDVAQGRQDVTTIFTAAKVKQAIAKLGVQLVSYKDVLK